MAYNATYDTDDIAPITIDFIGNFGSEGVGLMGLLALGVMLTLVVGAFTGVGRLFGMR